MKKVDKLSPPYWWRVSGKRLLTLGGGAGLFTVAQEQVSAPRE
jgi:hypothetical protein